MNDAIYAAALLVIMLVLSSSIAAWSGAIRRTRSRQPLIPAEPDPHVPWGLVDVLLGLVAPLFASLFAGAWLHESLQVDLSQSFDEMNLNDRGNVMLASSLSSLAGLIVMIIWLAIRYRGTNLGVSLGKLGSDLRLGVVAFVMLAPIVYGLQLILVQLIESKHPLLELLKEEPSARFFAIAAFAAVIVAPCWEEFFFRQLVQGWLERLSTDADRPVPLLIGGSAATARDTATPFAEGTGELAPEAETTAEVTPVVPASQPRWAIVVSSLLFAGMHWSHGPDPIPLFVLALGLGYIYQQTHRITACVVVHFLLNAATLGMWLTLRE